MTQAARVALVVIAAGVAWLIAKNRQAATEGGLDISGIYQRVSDTADTVKNTILEVIGMRGIRNNNPGNIRRSGIQWQGMSAQQTDPEFVQFITPEYGIRALSHVLDTYSGSYGLNTVRGIIGRYAPSSENNTTAYINAVAQALGVLPDQAIDVQARKADLIEAIITHENGINPYTLAAIQYGAAMS